MTAAKKGAAKEKRKEADGKPPRKDRQEGAAAPEAAAEQQAAAEQHALSAELAELRTRYETLLRQVADAQNAMREMQERTAREQERMQQYAAETVAVGLLPVLDDLERALDGWQQMDPDSGLLEGLELVHRNWLEVFSRFNIERLTPERGVSFDPHRHEAMSTVTQDAAAPNTVWEVMQPGYLLHDRVLRPARVVVTQPEAAAEDSAQEQMEASEAGPSDAAG